MLGPFLIFGRGSTKHNVGSGGQGRNRRSEYPGDTLHISTFCIEVPSLLAPIWHGGPYILRHLFVLRFRIYGTEGFPFTKDYYVLHVATGICLASRIARYA